MNDVSKRLDDPLSSWMRELAAVQPASAFPDARVIWWQAQALRRIDQQRRLATLLEVGEHIQVGCGAAAAVLLIYLINAIPETLSPLFAPLAAVCVVLVGGIAVALTIWGARRHAD